MRYKLITLVSLATFGAAAAADADRDCEAPVADWQPKDTLRQKLEQQGWEVRRIEVDDGCYEIEGFDQDGNAVEAEYAPDSLAIRKLETTYYDDHD